MSTESMSTESTTDRETDPPMTEPTQPADVTAPPAREQLPFYWRLWKKTPRELAVHLIGFPLALAAFSITLTLFSSGVGTLVTLVGFFIVIAALYTARGFGVAEIVQLEWAGRPAIPRPEWQDSRARLGFWGWLRSVVGNGHYWLYLLHSMLVNFIVTLVSWTLIVTWIGLIFSPVIHLLWGDRVRLGNLATTSWIAERFGLDLGSGGLFVASIIVGLIMLATLPFLSRGLVLVRYYIARGMLSAFKSDALQRQVIDLTLSRGAAQSAEGHSLRRLERDIHDGPQQRLVRQQMDLAAADRQLDANPTAARALIASAMEQSREALEELRALSRGFAPPILLDRGLVAALESSAVRSAIPVRVTSSLPEGTALPQETERNAYFAASEALANAAKHSGATQIEVSLTLRRDLERNGTWLVVSVIDNGTGGAIPTAGHGLAGLDERLRGLGGILEIDSPAGGPTVVTAHLPVTTIGA